MSQIAGIDKRARRAERLAMALDNVRVARPAAIHVLNLTNDPNADATKLGRAIEADPVLTAQVMRLANSAAFGMSGRVTNAPMAVSLVGFSSVRSIAAFLATGMQDHKSPTPPGFWGHAAAVAAGASIIGPRFSVTKGDAFAAGLLHDLGLAIVHAADSPAHLDLLRQTTGDDALLCDLELEEFGMSHPMAAAHLLSEWRFPDQIVHATACHHLGPSADPLSQVVLAADALAHVMVAPAGEQLEHASTLVTLGFDQDTLGPTLEMIREYTVEILSTFQPGASAA